MATFGKAFALSLFAVSWVVGVLGSLAVSLAVIAGVFSIVQILVGVPMDETLIRHLAETLGYNG